MTDGTSTIRISVASTRIATASPSPISLTCRMSNPITNDRNTAIITSAAAVIRRPVVATPFATDSALSWVRLYSSRMRESRKIS